MTTQAPITLLAHHFIPHLRRALLLLLGAGRESFTFPSINTAYAQQQILKSDSGSGECGGRFSLVDSRKTSSVHTQGM